MKCGMQPIRDRLGTPSASWSRRTVVPATRYKPSSGIGITVMGICAVTIVAKTTIDSPSDSPSALSAATETGHFIMGKKYCPPRRK